MLPDWFTKPESIFRTVLWAASPFFTWLIGRIVLRRFEAWHAARTEANARISLLSLHKSLENPPTLLESVAFIVCFLPLPFFLAALFGVLYFLPYPSPNYAHLDPYLAQEFRRSALVVAFLIVYIVFGVLAVHGFYVMHRLRHGEARYAENYKTEVQSRINKLKEKFPKL
jgi:sterol desaturase/sphingolipid hydroxylase (fatty acid hydroxylase superfamily)